MKNILKLNLSEFMRITYGDDLRDQYFCCVFVGLKNTSKPILTKADNSYVSDLYLAGNTLAVKNYFVVFSATERPYCGNGSVFSSDVLKLQVLPDVLNPQISELAPGIACINSFVVVLQPDAVNIQNQNTPKIRSCFIHSPVAFLLQMIAEQKSQVLGCIQISNTNDL